MKRFTTLSATTVMFLGALSAGPLAAQTDPYALLEAASARFEGIETLCGDFRQVLEVPIMNDSRETTGRLCQGQPNLFSMRWEDPAGDAVVIDGDWAWSYTPSEDPKQVFKVDAELMVGYDLTREFLESPREKYEAEYLGSETVEGVPSAKLALVPREPTYYDAATVWIDPSSRLIRKVVIYEGDSSRTVILSDLVADGELDRDVFTFTPPPGTHVVVR